MPPKESKPYTTLFRRSKKAPAFAPEVAFAIGDKVAVHTGPNKNVIGVVQRMMPVMMEIKVISRAPGLDVVKCKHSSARLVDKVGRPNEIAEKEYAIIAEESVVTMEGRELERKIAIEELTEAISALDLEHRVRMKAISALVDKVNRLSS